MTVVFTEGDKDYIAKLNQLSQEAGNTQQAKAAAEQAVSDVVEAGQVVLENCQQEVSNVIEAGQEKLEACQAEVQKASAIAGGTAPDSLALGGTPAADIAKKSDIENLVPDQRTINGKPLTSDVTLSAKDVGAVKKISIEDPVDLTRFDTAAEETIVDITVGNKSFSIDSSKYSDGNTFTFNLVKVNLATTTITLTEGDFSYPFGSDDQVLTILPEKTTFSVELTKRGNIWRVKARH